MKLTFFLPFLEDDDARYEEDKDDSDVESYVGGDDEEEEADGTKPTMSVNHQYFATLGFVGSPDNVLRSADKKRCIPTKSEITKAHQTLVSRLTLFMVLLINYVEANSMLSPH